MKKNIFTLLFVITSTIGFSQIKHNKFTTGIKFAQFNPTFEFWHTIPSEIADQSGYFLSNHYDDQAYGVHPSLVKLDVDGNLIFDSIYEFTPLNLSGYTYVRSATTSSTSHTVLYQTGSMSTVNAVCPYIVNYDLNGNINWHVGFSNDTLDIEAFKIIHTQDGGYLVAGSIYDWYNSIEKPSGALVKIDNSGTLLWHKLYTNKDSMEVNFKDAIETPTGGILAVGETNNFSGGARILGEWDKLVTLVRTDDQGNMIWNKGITLDAPIDNSYGFGDITIGMMNLTDAFVSYGAYDSTDNVGKFAISSINVNTGIVNWTKVFSLPPSQEVSIRKSVADFKGNIVVSASDYNNSTGVLFHLDDQGGVLGSRRFISNAASGHFPYETIVTKDGGFMHVNEVGPKDVLVVKTDGNLDPSCSNIDSSYAYTLSGVINVDTSYIGLVDSIFTLANFSPVQMTAGSPFNTVSDDSLICVCNNVINGTVTVAGVTPVNNAKVFLFRKGVVPKPWHPIDSTTTDAGGNYVFNYVPTDSFIVRVEPDTTLFPGAMTSYFKEPQWCYRWDLAGVFAAHCDSGVIQKDVKLVVPPPLTGNSSLAGYIFESAGSFQKGNMQPGDPIPGIDITVDQSPGGIAGGSTSNPTGHYSLNGLDTNKTYVITIDLPGLPHDSVWTININLNDTTLDSLNFYIDSTGIYILEDSFGVGVDVVQTENLDVDLYPNPSNGIFTININAIKPEDIEMHLTDKVGRTISVNTKRLLEGDNKIVFDDISTLPSGIYFLKIKEGNNLHIKKIVKL